MMKNAVEFDSITKSYGGKAVLNSVSFAVKEGETAALLGINGAGKTTSLECLEGLRVPDGGSISVLGISRQQRAIKNLLGVQLQSTALPDEITPPEAMKLFCAWHNTGYRGDLLERFGLDEYAKKQYSALSAGRKRRLHLALALCHRPQVLVLDEPTAGLDVEGRRALHEEIRQLKKEGVSILMATHDMDEAEELCDDIIFLHEGRVVLQGTPLELTARAAASRVIIKTSPGIKMPAEEAGICTELENGYLQLDSADIKTTLHNLLNQAERQTADIVDLRVERASLEDIFMNIAKGGIA